MLNRNAKIAYKRYICDVIGLISGLLDKNRFVGYRGSCRGFRHAIGNRIQGFSTIKRLKGDFSSKVNTSGIDKGLIALVVLTRGLCFKRSFVFLTHVFVICMYFNFKGSLTRHCDPASNHEKYLTSVPKWIYRSDSSSHSH